MSQRNLGNPNILAAALLIALGADCGAALAQDNSSAVETVTVTANKRVQNIQDVPISIVPLGAEVLNQTSAVSVAQLQQYVPGLTIDESVGNVASSTYLRGAGTGRLNPLGDPSVAYYEDDVYIAGLAGVQFDLLDVGSIDVLKGPQGTLFGRNAAAGAIQISTLRPLDQFDFTSDTTLGDYLLFMERASVTGPIDGTDGHLLYRFSIGYERRNGFTDNIAFDAPNGQGNPVDNISHLAARGQLEWVGNSFNFLLSVEGQQLRDGMTPSLITTSADTDLLPFPTPLPPPYNCPGESNYRQCYNASGVQDQDLYAVTGRADWTTDIGILTSITAFRHSRFVGSQDNDGTDVDFLYSNFGEFDNEFSEELRLANHETPDSRAHWVVGLYYLNTDIRANAFYSITGFATENDFTKYGVNSYAAFGQLAYDITNQLTVTAGVRYTDDVKQDYRTFSVDGFPFYTVTPSGKWANLNPAITVDYKFTPTINAYVSYRQGWISGGFQDIFPSSALAANTPFNPETANSYTAGVKSSWLDDHLVVNAEGFYVRYSDLQVQQTAPLGFGGGFTEVINNAGAAKDPGVDLSIAVKPIDRLTLNASMTYQKATYSDYVSPPGTPPADQFDYTGNRLPYQSVFSGAFSAQYNVALPNEATLLVRGEYNYRSFFYVHPSNPNAPGTFQPAYGLLNAELTYVPPSDAWELELWGKNLTRATYYADLSDAITTGGPGEESALGTLGEPITFGARLHVHLN